MTSAAASTERTERQIELDMSQQDIQQELRSNDEDVFLKMITAFFNIIYFLLVIFYYTVISFYYSVISFSAFLSFISCWVLFIMMVLDDEPNDELVSTVMSGFVAVLVFIVCCKLGPAWNRLSTSTPAVSESIQPVSRNDGDVILETVIKGVKACFNVTYFIFLVFYYSAIYFFAFLSSILCCSWYMHVLNVKLYNTRVATVNLAVVASFVGVLVFIMCFRSAWNSRRN